MRCEICNTETEFSKFNHATGAFDTLCGACSDKIRETKELLSALDRCDEERYTLDTEFDRGLMETNHDSNV